MMTSDEIQYVREWAASGNEPREEVPTGVLLCCNGLGGFPLVLSSLGLTIARLADALDAVCEVAKNSHMVIEQLLGSKVDAGQIEVVRKNRAELLGDS